MSLAKIQLGKKEWDAWRNLCTHLLDAGAVTQADLNSSVKDRQTSGQRLLEAVRTWGSKLCELNERDHQEVK